MSKVTDEITALKDDAEEFYHAQIARQKSRKFAFIFAGCIVAAVLIMVAVRACHG